MRKLSTTTVFLLATLIKFALVIAIAILLSSCSSGWSCQKRYVTTPKTYDYKKHHVLTNYDQYILSKYKTTKAVKP